ncbi:MAG: hypothetical protein ACYDES_14395 [Acidimicrobiales bacterium]
MTGPPRGRALPGGGRRAGVSSLRSAVAVSASAIAVAIAVVITTAMVVSVDAGGQAGAAPTAPPRISATPSTVNPGQHVSVGAYDLTPLTDFQVQVCGNGGYGNSGDCTLASATTAATSEIGHFIVDLLVVIPPAPCPCVVEAVPLVGRDQAVEGPVVTTPLTIVGAPNAPVVINPAREAPSGLVVEQAALTGSSSWAQWFGGMPHRTLVFRLRDAGPDIIPSTPVVLRSGKGSSATEVVAAPVVPPLFPGQGVAYRVPVTFPALAFGHYQVTGTLGSIGQTVTFTAGTTFVPWGVAIILALLLLGVAVLIVFRILRRRRRRRTASAGSPEPAGPETEASPVVDGTPGESGKPGTPVSTGSAL